MQLRRRQILLSHQLDLFHGHRHRLGRGNPDLDAGFPDMYDLDLDIVADENGLPGPPPHYKHAAPRNGNTSRWEWRESVWMACRPRRVLTLTTIGASRLTVGGAFFSTERIARQSTSRPIAGCRPFSRPSARTSSGAMRSR